jgi:hypothetical protein
MMLKLLYAGQELWQWAEKTPIVKQLSERQFCAVRLSGMGVALAPVIGKI